MFQRPYFFWVYSYFICNTLKAKDGNSDNGIISYRIRNYLLTVELERKKVAAIALVDNMDLLHRKYGNIDR